MVAADHARGGRPESQDPRRLPAGDLSSWNLLYAQKLRWARTLKETVFCALNW